MVRVHEVAELLGEFSGITVYASCLFACELRPHAARTVLVEGCMGQQVLQADSLCLQVPSRNAVRVQGVIITDGFVRFPGHRGTTLAKGSTDDDEEDAEADDEEVGFRAEESTVGNAWSISSNMDAGTPTCP